MQRLLHVLACGLGEPIIADDLRKRLIPRLLRFLVPLAPKPNRIEIDTGVLLGHTQSLLSCSSLDEPEAGRGDCTKLTARLQRRTVEADTFGFYSTMSINNSRQDKLLKC